MKKLSWSLALGIAVGTTLGYSQQSSALSPERIAQKLGQVPVFLIVDEQGEPLPVLINEQGQPSSPEEGVDKPIIPIYLSQSTAQEELDTAVEQAGTTDREFQVVSFSFGFLYKERMEALRGQAQFLLVPEGGAYRPTTALLGSAPEAPQENPLFFTIKPDNVPAPVGTPLYFAVVADENGQGSAVLVGENRDRIPLFFNREEMVNNIEQLKESNPDITDRLGVGVMRLDQAIEVMAAGKDDELSEAFLFVPSPEARQFVEEFRKQVQEREAAGEGGAEGEGGGGGASQLAPQAQPQPEQPAAPAE
ncbi:MAG: hypothetical protein AAFY11_01500 [Cyanobacteria bacterium J06641_5]